jgi:hypothetical protein
MTTAADAMRSFRRTMLAMRRAGRRIGLWSHQPFGKVNPLSAPSAWVTMVSRLIVTIGATTGELVISN